MKKQGARKKWGYGEAQLEAVPGELLHNAREREAEEESPAPEPGESGTPLRAEAEAVQGEQRRPKEAQWGPKLHS